MKRSGKRVSRTALQRTLHILKPHVGRHWGLIILGLLALLADVVFRVLEPWPMKFAVDAVSSALGASIAERYPFGGTAMTTAIGCAVALALIIIGRAVTNFISTVSFAKVGARVATQLRSEVFHHVQSLSLRYHSRASIGDTSQRLVGDVGRLQEVAVTAGLPLVGNIITLVVLLVVMVIMNPLLSAIILLTAGLYLLISRISTPKITTAARSTRKGEGRLVGSAAEALAAIRVVQTYNLEEVVATEFTGGNERAMKAGVRAKRLAAALERSTDVLVGLSSAVVLGFGSWQVLRGAMTPGDLVLFFSYLKIAMRPLRDMAKYTGRIARAAASGERIADLLDERHDITDPPQPRPLTTVRGAIRFENLRSRDGHGKPLFNGLSLDIQPGEHVGLLGASGAGKSTLAAYLMRLMEPDHGRVLIDGIGVGEVRLVDLRNQLAVLLQESVLFQTTVRENIRYGRLDASDEDVEEAARRAGVADFIRSLPNGFDTELGNRGDTVSGGQRQRIAIARALIRNAPIVILDEATTGLDPASKALVSDSIAQLIAGRTTLSITHDVSAIAAMDRVVWLEGGRIVEQGAPADLVRRPDSRFARWISEQKAAVRS